MATPSIEEAATNEALDSGLLNVRWRDVGLLSLAVAVGCITALVVVVAVGKPDALATTALTLAIVSFGVQFAAYAASSSDASRLLHQSMTIYADTREALTTIQATTSTTQETHLSLIQQLLAELREKAQKAEQQAVVQPPGRRPLRAN